MHGFLSRTCAAFARPQGYGAGFGRRAAALETPRLSRVEHGPTRVPVLR